VVTEERVRELERRIRLLTALYESAKAEKLRLASLIVAQRLAGEEYLTKPLDSKEQLAERIRSDLRTKGVSLDLNELMERLPSNYSLLVEGPAGVGKAEYCLSLAKHYLPNGCSIVWVTTDASPDEVKEAAKKADLDLDKYEEKTFVFVDGFSGSTQRKYPKGIWVDAVNLTDLSIAVGQAVEAVGKPARIVFNSISTLFLHNPPEPVLRFFRVLTTRVKSEYGFVIFVLHSGMLDEALVNAMRSLVDGVIEMSFDEQLNRRFRVHHMRGVRVDTKWVGYEVTERGFELKPG